MKKRLTILIMLIAALWNGGAMMRAQQPFGGSQDVQAYTPYRSTIYAPGATGVSEAPESAYPYGNNGGPANAPAGPHRLGGMDGKDPGETGGSPVGAPWILLLFAMAYIGWRVARAKNQLTTNLENQTTNDIMKTNFSVQSACDSLRQSPDGRPTVGRQSSVNRPWVSRGSSVGHLSFTNALRNLCVSFAHRSRLVATLLLLVTMSIGQVWGNQYWIRGEMSSWNPQAMTVSADGYYEYCGPINGAKQFKICDCDHSAWDCGNTYNCQKVDAGFNHTDISDIGNYGGDNAYCWYTSKNYYILIYYPNTTVNSASDVKICASTTLPNDAPAETLYTISVVKGTPASVKAGAITHPSITANAPATGKRFDRWTTTSGVSVASATSATTTVSATAAGTVTATYTDITYCTLYSTMTHAYAWQSSNTDNKNAGWPGVNMSSTAEVINGTTYYHVDIDESKGYDKIIFSNNGSSQTSNLNIPNECNQLWNGSAWVAKPTPVATYLIRFLDSDGSTVLKSGQVEENTMPTPPADPTKASDAEWNYTFAAWTPALYNVNKAQDYTATYNKTRRQYTLTWNLDGGNVQTAGTTAGLVANGTTLTAPVVTKTGYTFAGWSPSVPAKMPAANATYTAQWNETKYTVTLTNATAASVSAGVTPVAITANEPAAGKRFSGWTTTGGATVANASAKSTTVTATAAGTATANYEDVSYCRLYVVKPAGWSTICAYMWKGGTNNAWPGVEITAYETINDVNYYYIDVDASVYDNIIFNNNNNGKETGTLTISDHCGEYYNGTSWEPLPTPEVKYAVTINNGDHGTVDPNGERQVGSTGITITATPAAGYNFQRWEVTDGAHVADASATTTTLTATATGSVTATYVEDMTSVWYIAGNSPFGGWGTSGINMTKESANIYTAEVVAPAAAPGDDEFAFKIYNSSTGKYWAANGYWVTRENNHPTLEQNDSYGNMRFKPDVPSATYTFTFDASSNILTVTYPCKPTGWKIDFDNALVTDMPFEDKGDGTYKLTFYITNDNAVFRVSDGCETYTLNAASPEYSSNFDGTLVESNEIMKYNGSLYRFVTATIDGDKHFTMGEASPEDLNLALSAEIEDSEREPGSSTIHFQNITASVPAGLSGVTIAVYELASASASGTKKQEFTTSLAVGATEYTTTAAQTFEAGKTYYYCLALYQNGGPQVYSQVLTITVSAYTITYGPCTSGHGSVSGTVASGSTVNVGDKVTLTATPEAGYYLRGWYRDEAGTDRIEYATLASNYQYQVTVDGDETVYAKFEAIPQNVKLAGNFYTGQEDWTCIDADNYSAGVYTWAFEAHANSNKEFVFKASNCPYEAMIKYTNEDVTYASTGCMLGKASANDNYGITNEEKILTFTLTYGSGIHVQVNATDKGCEAPTIVWATAPTGGEEGEQKTATVTKNDEGAAVTWESSNTAVATVNSEGVITYKSAGTTTITAKYTGSGDYCETLASVYRDITVTPSSHLYVYLGSQITLSAGEWVSNYKDIVIADGKLTANALGDYDVTRDASAVHVHVYQYYIKHPWNTSGSESNWVWKAMPIKNGVPTYTGVAGGTNGANVNWSTSDMDGKGGKITDGEYDPWFGESYVGSLTLGKSYNFIYEPGQALNGAAAPSTTGTLRVEEVAVEKTTITFGIKTVDADDAMIVGPGGTVTSTAGESGSAVVRETNVTFTAAAEDGYNFVGWYSEAECTNKLGNEASYTATMTGETFAIYAKFQQKRQVTAAWYLIGKGNLGDCWETDCKDYPMDKAYREMPDMYYRKVTFATGEQYFRVHNGSSQFGFSDDNKWIQVGYQRAIAMENIDGVDGKDRRNFKHGAGNTIIVVLDARDAAHPKMWYEYEEMTTLYNVAVTNAAGGSYELAVNSGANVGLETTKFAGDEKYLLTITPNSAEKEPEVTVDGNKVSVVLTNEGTYTYKGEIGNADHAINITYVDKKPLTVNLYVDCDEWKTQSIYARYQLNGEWQTSPAMSAMGGYADWYTITYPATYQGGTIQFYTNTTSPADNERSSQVTIDPTDESFCYKVSTEKNTYNEYKLVPTDCPAFAIKLVVANGDEIGSTATLTSQSNVDGAITKHYYYSKDGAAFVEIAEEAGAYTYHVVKAGTYKYKVVATYDGVTIEDISSEIVVKPATLTITPSSTAISTDDPVTLTPTIENIAAGTTVTLCFKVTKDDEATDIPVNENDGVYSISLTETGTYAIHAELKMGDDCEGDAIATAETEITRGTMSVTLTPSKDAPVLDETITLTTKVDGATATNYRLTVKSSTEPMPKIIYNGTNATYDFKIESVDTYDFTVTATIDGRNYTASCRVVAGAKDVYINYPWNGTGWSADSQKKLMTYCGDGVYTYYEAGITKFQGTKAHQNDETGADIFKPGKEFIKYATLIDLTPGVDDGKDAIFTYNANRNEVTIIAATTTLYRIKSDNGKNGTFYSNEVTADDAPVSFYASPSSVLTMEKFDKNNTSAWVRVDDVANTVAEGNIYVADANVSSHTLSNVATYTGDYYIYSHNTSLSEATIDQAPASGKKPAKMTYFNNISDAEFYNHYWVEWLDNGDAYATVGNKINRNLSIILPAYTLPQGTNLRYGFNPNTNYFGRSFLKGSTDKSGAWFLQLFGSNVFGTDKTTAMNGTNRVNFEDGSNWVYTADLTGVKPAEMKLVANYGGSEYYLLSPVGDPSYTQVLLGATSTTGDEKLKFRVIYDYKFNRLVAGWIPEADTITDKRIVESDILFVRNENEGVAQLVMGNEEALISSLQQVMFVLEFDKKNGASGESNYWISLPFDCRISDIFGIAGYMDIWGIQRYDGKRRAEIGWFAETYTFWTWMGADEILKKGEGYVLTIDRSAAPWREIGGKSILRLFFPSIEKGFYMSQSTIEPPITYPNEECTITTPENRIAQDSNWKLIGPNGYTDIQISRFESQSNDEHHLPVQDAAPNFLYEFTPETYTPGVGYYRVCNAQAPGFKYKAFFSYMVQFGGTINWTQYTKGENGVAPYFAAPQRAKADFTQTILTLDIYKGDNTRMDQTFIDLRKDATEGFDQNKDLTKMKSTKATQIYSVSEGEAYAGNALPLTTDTVALVVNVASTGDYTISMPSANNFVEPVLWDKETGIKTPLNMNEYLVLLEKGMYENRFYLILGEKVVNAPTSIDGVAVEDVNLPKDQTQKLLINGQLYLLRDGRLYDATGKRAE